MTAINPFVHEFWVDLKKGLPIEREKKPLSQGDAFADKFVVRVQEAGKDVDLSGVGVSAKVIRYDGQTVPLMGEVADGAACVTLDAACYTVPGDIRVSIALSAGDMVQSVLVVLLNVETSQTNVIVDNGVIGDLSSLLGAIADMQAATAEARAELEDIQQRADVLFAGADIAPAIIVEAVNAVATVTDAAARDAVAVVSIIEADVSGTADPVAGTVATITPRTAVQLYHAAAYDEGAEAALVEELPEDVYGGMLDWVSGVLTVTHKLLDVSTKTWKASSTTAGRFVATQKTDALVAASHYPVSAGSGQDNTFFRSSGSQIAVNTDYATLDEWTAYLAAQKDAGTPVMLLYELQEADRYTIQLTTHQVAMLKGSNAVWSDAGYTDIAYVADTQTYVDDRVSAWERTGLTIAALGDSIMAGDGNGTVGIGEILAQHIGGECWEYAKGGATIVWDAEDAASSNVLTKRQNILHQADLLISEHATAPDIILLDGGTNDISTGATPLGEITPTYEDELDTSTFAGAMESLIKRLKTAYPSSVILYIRAHRMGSRSNVRQKTYGDVAVEICDKWSVGLVDVYNRSGLNTWMPAYHQYTSKGDMTHPTQEGYEKYYLPLILAEVKRHIGEV